MNISQSSIRALQRWVVAATLGMTVCILWIGATTSGIPKPTVFALGSSLITAMFFAECLLLQRFAVELSTIERIALVHLPLFITSAVLTRDSLYTRDALLFGLSSVVAFFGGSSLFPSRTERRWLFIRIELIAAIVCLVGLLQFFFADNLGLSFFISEDRRIKSLFGNSNFFSSFLVLTIPITLAGVLQERQHTITRWIRYTLILASAICLFATQARSSMIGILVSLVVFALLIGRKSGRIVWLALAGIVAAATLWVILINPSLGDRILSAFTTTGSWGRRTYFWRGASDAFLAAPFTGHGIGSFEKTLFAYRAPEYWKVSSEDIVPHAHNEFIEIAVEYGLVGMALACGTLFFVLRTGIRYARTMRHPDRYMAAAMTSAIIGIAVDNLANVSLRQAPIAFFAWLLMGILTSMRPEAQSKAMTLSFKTPVWIAVLPLAAWLGFAFAYGREQLNTFSADTHLLRGIRASAVRYSEKTIHELKSALALNPKSLLSHSVLSAEYVRMQQWEDALHQIEELQTLSPLYPKSSLMKAHTLWRLNRNPEALHAIENELRLRNHPEGFHIQSFIFSAMADTLKERNALIETINKSIEGRITTELRHACERLAVLNRSEKERAEVLDLFGTLQQTFPAGREFVETLKRSTVAPK